MPVIGKQTGGLSGGKEGGSMEGKERKMEERDKKNNV